MTSPRLSAGASALNHPTTDLGHVIAAVANELAVPTAIAARIVDENAERIASRRMPAGVSAFGYAGAQGHHLTLTIGDRSIVELKVSAGAIDEIEAHRAKVPA